MVSEVLLMRIGNYGSKASRRLMTKFSSEIKPRQDELREGNGGYGSEVQ